VPPQNLTTSAAGPAPRLDPDDPIITSEDAGVRFRILPVLLTALVATAVAFTRPLTGLEPRAHHTLIILVITAGLWISEAFPVAVTALGIPVFGMLFGVTDAKGAFAGFGDPIVFLFFGTFLLTDAAAQHGLNARITRSVLSSDWVRAKPSRLLWAIALLGCVISAWINNTATTALLLPLALTAESFGSRRLLVGILLMTAYAPSLGGIATPVGTAPNLIGLRLLEQATGHRPSFAQWCLLFAPLAVITTALSAWWLGARAGHAAHAGDTAITWERRPWSRAERTLVPLFGVVVLLWITPGILAATPLRELAWVKVWQARLPEPAVPLLGALLLFALPAGAAGGRILDAAVFRRVDWSTLLLFGGGLALGGMMFDSGLATALGQGIFHAMPIHGTFGIILASTLMAVLVSEMTSNTASAALVVPVVLALARSAGMDPLRPALAATIGCSFGFMLPVSTPPNALVYGTGRIRIREMVVNGLLLDVVGVLLVSGWMTVFG
jgi:solute carrier family 13 (sodium-dependent dicarboxylate transporter), member 2/3/5